MAADNRQDGGAAGELFLTAHHATSDRHAILEDDGTSCWLYLSEPGNIRPVKDCFVYSRVEPAAELNIEEIKKSGATPRLTKAVASRTAIISKPTSTDFSFRWSAGGESVAVLHKNAPIAMIVSSNKRGYSKALATTSFFGEPWDDGVFAKHFK